MRRLINWLHDNELLFFLGAFLAVALVTLGGC